MIALRLRATEAECLALVAPRGPWYAGRGWMACASIGQADQVRAAFEVLEDRDDVPLLLTSGEGRRREGVFVACCAMQGRLT